MTANTLPIFTDIPKNSWGLQGTSSLVTSAITATTPSTYDGTTGTYLVFTAGSVGSFVSKLVCEAGGTNAAGVLRVFINNGSSTATPANNVLYLQYSLPATTAAAASATAHIEIPLNIQLQSGYRLYAALGSASNPIGGGWTVTAIAGDY